MIKTSQKTNSKLFVVIVEINELADVDRLIDILRKRLATPVAEPTPVGQENQKTTKTIVSDSDLALECLRLKEPANNPAVKQFPLVSGTKGVGMINVLLDNTAAGIVPERPFDVGDHAIANFLIPRILEPMKAKYGFDYTILQVQKQLTWIYIKGQGPLDENIIKNLQSAAAWTFLKALERVQQ